MNSEDIKYLNPVAIHKTGEEPTQENFYANTKNTGEILPEYPEVRFELEADYDSEHRLLESGEDFIAEITAQPFNGVHSLEADEEQLEEIPSSEIDEFAIEVEEELDKYFRDEVNVPIPEHLSTERYRVLEALQSIAPEDLRSQGGDDL